MRTTTNRHVLNTVAVGHTYCCQSTAPQCFIDMYWIWDILINLLRKKQHYIAIHWYALVSFLQTQYSPYKIIPTKKPNHQAWTIPFFNFFYCLQFLWLFIDYYCQSFWQILVLMVFCTVQSHNADSNRWEMGMRQKPSEPRRLHFVQVVVQSWNAFLQTLAFACFRYNRTRLCCGIHWVSWKDLPMVKHTLREGLATSVWTKVSCET